MKKFIFTRFGVNNFKPEWFKWRMSVLEDFTLQGIEQNDDNELYWLIFINKDAPLSEKLRLNQIIDRSKSRRSIYLIDIDYMYEIKNLAIKFVNEHAEKNERIMLAQCDADDVYRKGFFREIEKFDSLDNNPKETVLYTFPYGYRFLLMEKVASPWVEECRSMNNFIITADRNVTAFDSPHHLYKSYFKKKGYKFISNTYLQYMWFKTESPDNVDTIYNEQKYDICRQKVCSSENIKDIKEVAFEFGLDINKINKFYEEYPELPVTREAFIYKNSIVDVAKKAGKNFSDLKKIFIEFTTEEFNRCCFHSYLKNLQKKYSVNGLEALGMFWGLALKTNKNLLNFTDIISYFDYLKSMSDDIIICLAACDDASKYYNKFFDKNGFGLKTNLSDKFRHSYAAVIDPEKNAVIEKCGKSKVSAEYVHKFNDDSCVKFSVSSLGFFEKKTRGASFILSSSDTDNKKVNKDDKEYCIGKRGLNVLVYSKLNKKVIDSFNVDFYMDETLTINRNF